jgi:hypothetical protein
MKLTKLFFVFFLCFFSGIWFNSCKSPPPPQLSSPAPSLNDEYRNIGLYINLMRENRVNFFDLDYRLSRPFTADRQNRDDLNVGVENRALRIEEITTRPNTISFSQNDKSLFFNFSSTPNETFEIFFIDNRFLLKFERQPNNHFYLVSVMYGNEPYVLRSGPIPHLEIKVRDNRP